MTQFLSTRSTYAESACDELGISDQAAELDLKRPFFYGFAMSSNITVAGLRRAIVLQRKIEIMQDKLERILSHTSGSGRIGRTKGSKRKRKISAATKAKMAAAARARWKKAKALE